MRQRWSNPLAAVILTVLVTACSGEPPEPSAAPERPTFVGSAQCADCHQAEFDQWQGSQHQLAMQEANPASVLGDFSGVSIPYFDTASHFFMRDGGYYIRTQNAAGNEEAFEITHTFGIWPLQQYLVDGPGGRKQALQFAWDARPRDVGGQRWYHLYPDEYIGPDDPLHWSGRYFNWNYMCAECHSTNVKAGYDLDSDAFDTTYDEISVGCEACHGPASGHLQQARAGAFDGQYGLPVDLDDRDDSAWVMNAATGIAERTAPNASRQQPESCGRCHARRSVIADEYEYGALLADTHLPSLLEEGLYFADGRIQDEVYVYGSFLQSRMYAAGVTCSDCHDPHSGKLHAGPAPNATCAQCHAPSKFASPDHGAQQTGDCVGCHMRERTYMGVDGRRDHSFRIPNAGQSEAHYGPVIAAGRNGGANAQLIDGIANETFPAIARATMLTLLEPLQDETAAGVIVDQLGSPEPLIRIAALRAMRQQDPELRMRAGSHLLRDPVRAVRIEAALTYADYRDLLPADDARAYADAADEYRTALGQSVNLPQSALQLAEFESRNGDEGAAERLYGHALRLDPKLAIARHSYGLFLVRAGRPEQALPELKRAAGLAPDQERFVYVYAVALNSLGHGEEAIGILEDARARFPNSFDIAWALATMLRDSGDVDQAKRVAQALLSDYPDNGRVIALLQSL